MIPWHRVPLRCYHVVADRAHRCTWLEFDGCTSHIIGPLNAKWSTPPLDWIMFKRLFFVTGELRTCKMTSTWIPKGIVSFCSHSLTKPFFQGLMIGILTMFFILGAYLRLYSAKGMLDRHIQPQIKDTQKYYNLSEWEKIYTKDGILNLLNIVSIDSFLFKHCLRIFIPGNLASSILLPCTFIPQIQKSCT